MIPLGVQGKDIVTGYVGLVMARTEYLTGCNQILLTPQKLTADGKRQEGEWFDEQRIEVVGKKVLDLRSKETPGADEASAPKK